MQPYFMPYLGYFQLMNVVDVFVIYDNIQFTKKGWIHRNRILVNGKPDYITLPLKSDSDFLSVEQRVLAADFKKEKKKLLLKIQETYRKAPFYNETCELIKGILNYESNNLFEFIYHSVIVLCEYLSIESNLVVSSSIDIDHNLKSENKVIAICKALGATQYLNPEGGIELYNSERFQENGISLGFHKFNPVPYKQISDVFVSHLSIIDVLMFCDKNDIKFRIDNEYTVI